MDNAPTQLGKARYLESIGWRIESVAVARICIGEGRHPACQVGWLPSATPTVGRHGHAIAWEQRWWRIRILLLLVLLWPAWCTLQVHIGKKINEEYTHTFGHRGHALSCMLVTKGLAGRCSDAAYEHSAADDAAEATCNPCKYALAAW